MPIDPSIALGVRTPQIQLENPLEAYGKVAQIQALIGQQKLLPGQLQLQQGQIAGQQQENAMRGVQLKNLQDIQAAYASANKSNPDGTTSFDMDHLKSLLGTTPGGMEALTHITAFEKGQTDLQEAQGKVDLQHRDNGGSIGAAVSTIKDPVAAANTFLTMTANGVKNKTIDPKTVAPYAQSVQSALEQDPTGAAVAPILKQITDTLIKNSPGQTKLQSESQTAEARAKTADIAGQKLPGELAVQAATLPKVQAETAKVQQETSGTQPISPAEQARLDVEKQNAARTLAAQQETARHNTVEEKQGNVRLANEQQGLNIRRVEADPFGQFGINKTPIGGGVPGAGGALQTGEDYLRTLPPGMAAQVKAIAEGRQNPPPRASSGVALQIMNAVNQYDPQFSLQKAQIRKAFTTGNDGRNIGALNTAAVHLDQLSEVSQALANGSFRPGNQVFNAFKNMFGNAAPTNFEGIKAAVSSEMASALKGNATDQEISSIKSTIDKSASPEQLAGAVKTNLDILGAKLNTYKERYNQQIPNDTNWSPVMPTARAVFDKHGINPTAGPSSVSGSNQPIAEGTVIVNPQTKQRLVLKGGQWVPAQ